MSLIEQAAKRLRELEQSGVHLQESREKPSSPSTADLPTPEALVRVLEAKDRAIPLGDAYGPVTHAVERTISRDGKATESRAHKIAPPSVTPRRVDLKLSALAARGFITPDSPTLLADEFRVIKRPIIRNAMGRSGAAVKNGNLVMVTSAVPGEGKTFTAVNLAMSIALEFDNTVLLVDGDVAQPQLPNLLGIPTGPGLLDLLTRDDVDVADTLLKTNVEKLIIMPAGSRHARATELLASAQMITLLQELGSRYSDRIIIFDSPPLLATTESRVMASHMGQILMVVAADSTTPHAVKGALSAVENCDVVLMMLNKASRTEVGTYYGYGDAE